MGALKTLAGSELTLIRSKLLVPSPAGLLHRPRICQAIERGLERKLTLVSAPAGYGKTSALVDFARRSSAPVCWYTADERDRDVSILVEYLIGAIRERFPSFGERAREALESRAGDLLQNPTAVVGELSNEMLDLDTPFVLVIDNYEALEGALGIRQFIHRLLDVLPADAHLMLASRVLPDVPVTQLVAKRQLVGLTEQDLRFEAREIRELLNLSGIEISEGQARAIAANAEGWITGVLLLADLLEDEAGMGLLDTERATTQTYGYLATEVLSRQPPDVQRFLRSSSVLREMSPRLCREILQIERPRGLLTEIERRNLFVTRFGKDAAATYRYHDLFRDFLHERLRGRDPDSYTELHRRAADWFERENEVEEAVYHYLTAEAYPQATALMERVAMEWFTRGRQGTLLRWAEALPEEVRDQAPRLSLHQSRVLTDRYDYEGARQALVHAMRGFASRGDEAHMAKVHDQRAALALFEGRYEDTLAEAHTALRMLGEHEIAERAGAQRLRGRAYVGLGRLDEGIAQLQEALALYRQVDSPYNVVNLLQDLTFAFASRGRLDEAAACLNEALAVARRLGAPAQLAGVLNNLGMLHYVQGEYRRALALYEEGLAAARRGDDPRGQANIADGMASIYRDVGAYQRAESLYDRAWRIARGSRPGQAVRILSARADIYRWQGDYGRALDVLGQARQIAEEKGLDFERRGILSVAEGMALVESGETETGLRLLSDGVRFLERRQARRELARARFLLAKAHLLAEDEPQASMELRRAMELAEEIGTDQFAVVEGQHAEDLLKLGASEGVAPCRDVLERAHRSRALKEDLLRGDGEAREEGTGRLEVYALGEGRVVRDGRPIPSSAWRAAMARELFFYILLHGPVERDAIGLVFWPDFPPDRMRDNFYTTLYRVRRAVGSDAVVVENGRYRMGDVDYWFDVEEFEALVERARLLPPGDWQAEDLWRRAVELYQGDFLPEVNRTWSVPKREALRELHLEALIGMGRCHEARGAFEEAISWYRQGLEVDGWREDIHRRVMRCHMETGQRPAAIAQYRQCQRILRRELDVEPSEETTRLYERIVGREEGK